MVQGQNWSYKQGDVISGFIFLIVEDWIMRNTTAGNKTGIRWNFTSKLEDLDFADDIALMSSCYTHMQTKKIQLNQFAARTGLRINKKEISNIEDKQQVRKQNTNR